MFSKILVCSDGSEPAQHATRVAADITARFGADLTLLSVFNPSSVLATFAMAPEAAPPADVLTTIADQTHCLVQKEAGGLLDASKTPFHFQTKMGHPVEEILAAAEGGKSDLIVLGSRGLGTWKALLLGSVSDGVLHHAHCPVLIVRNSPAPFTKILLACDGSAGAFLATQAAGLLARKYGVPLSVLNVVEPLSTLVQALQPQSVVAEVRAREMALTRVRTMVNQCDCVYSLAQQTGHPAETIVQYAEENEVPLIVLGSRGMSTLKALALGSVSYRVASHAHCSVLVVR